MSVTPLRFTGISDFSDDFQAILDRAVAIASLPLRQLQQEQADILARKQLLTDLRNGVAQLTTALHNLAELGASRALSASSSNPSVVSVTLNGATQAATYTISDVTSLARAASETTLWGYATADSTPVSGDGVLELVVGSNSYTIDLTGQGRNNLQGLRDAINQLNAGVTATILNTGDPSAPYYLLVSANQPGATTLQLRETAGDPNSNILTATNQGSDAVFRLNGLPVTRPTNTITDVVPGVTFTLLDKTNPGQTVTITLGPSRTRVANAISALVSAYNALRVQVNAQIGEGAGKLSGDFIVRLISQRMRELASYEAPSGPIRRLADFGLSFSEAGEMSFDTATFYSLTESQFNSLLDFLGSAVSGFGALASRFEEISDPIRGLIKTQQDYYDAADDRLSQQINALTERVNQMQQTLLAKLEQADALLAQLEGQQKLLEASIQGLNLTLYGRRES